MPVGDASCRLMSVAGMLGYYSSQVPIRALKEPGLPIFRDPDGMDNQVLQKSCHVSWKITFTGTDLMSENGRFSHNQVWAG